MKTIRLNMYKFCYTSLKLTVTDGKDCSMGKHSSMFSPHTLVKFQYMMPSIKIVFVNDEFYEKNVLMIFFHRTLNRISSVCVL